MKTKQLTTILTIFIAIFFIGCSNDVNEIKEQQVEVKNHKKRFDIILTEEKDKNGKYFYKFSLDPKPEMNISVEIEMFKLYGIKNTIPDGIIGSLILKPVKYIFYKGICNSKVPVIGRSSKEKGIFNKSNRLQNENTGSIIFIGLDVYDAKNVKTYPKGESITNMDVSRVPKEAFQTTYTDLDKHKP